MRKIAAMHLQLTFAVVTAYSYVCLRQNRKINYEIFKNILVSITMMLITHETL
jgi:hypothetical protein